MRDNLSVICSAKLRFYMCLQCLCCDFNHVNLNFDMPYSSLSLLFLRLEVEPVHHPEQGVAGDDIVEVFPAVEAVDVCGYVGGVAQDVPGVNHEGQAAAQDALREARVPD